MAFIIAAKALVRHKRFDDTDFAEYFLVGTLARFLASRGRHHRFEKQIDEERCGSRLECFRSLTAVTPIRHSSLTRVCRCRIIAPMGFIFAVFAAIIISLTTAGPAIDPDPYDEVKVYRTWRDNDARHLACCILGQSGDERGRTLAVFDSTAVGWRRLFLDSDRGFRPWALELAELDGDPLPEVVVGAHKSTRFDPVVRNRIFVYDLTAEGGLYAKWLGSKLGGTPSRFFVGPGPDGRDRLHCVEEGRPEITHRYRWHGFGFTWEAEVASEGTS